MALSAIALVSLDEVKSRLEIEQGNQDARLEALINLASAICEDSRFANRPLKQRAYTNLRLPAQRDPSLYPPAAPINAAETVTLAIAGTTLTVWKAEADGEPSLKDVMVRADHADPVWAPDHFFRPDGWLASSPRNMSPILLSYTGGLATVPESLKDAVHQIIGRLYRDQVLKHADTVQISTPVGIIERPDRYVPDGARDYLQSIRSWRYA